MKKFVSLFVVSCMIVFSGMFSSCTTTGGVNWEEATEAVIFVDLVLTKQEEHGLDLNIIYDYGNGVIVEESKRLTNRKE